MSVNSMSINQANSLLTSFLSQVKGVQPIDNLDLSAAVSVAQSSLDSNFDNVIGALSQVLSKTIFSIRPYYRKFPNLYMDSTQWGSFARKIQELDSNPEKNAQYDLTDGQELTKTYSKPKVIQTNFYGGNAYSRKMSIVRDTLYQAFRGPQELAEFLSLRTQNLLNQVEQDHETEARASICNLITGIYSAGNTNQIVHLLTEYNAYTGESFDDTTIKAPENYAPFMRWVFARLATISTYLTERTDMFHGHFSAGTLTRHTPQEMQQCYLLTRDVNNALANSIAVTIKEKFIPRVKFEPVSYWQAFQNPSAIMCKPVYTMNGTVTVPEEPVAIDNVFGVIFDRDACGITIMNTWAQADPIDATTGVTNIVYHYTDRWANDFSENAVILMLD